ncbi:tetratricopeptide repeat protein [Actinoplanes sp. NPDC051494]|uniref:tetratricopeptide repeat protein n=1 Tax=Actinoplanes sp. NPDC051494 TaxID=3363907 RepID=UPI0037B8B6BF
MTEQHVSATGGFAYGVVGGDLHTVPGGAPLYVLRGYTGPAAADPAGLRAMPSRMLNAATEVVTFTGRTDELEELHTWLTTGTRFRVRWMHAPGGQGKSRLAARIAAQAAAAGWKVLVADQGAGPVLDQPGSQNLDATGSSGVLLLVDYADRWPQTTLTWMFSNVLLYRPGVPTRVLLVARTDWGWHALRSSLGDPAKAIDTSVRELPPLGDGRAERERMFVAARDSFAAVYGVTDPAGIEPPAALGHPDFALILTLHVAALVAVDARVNGRAVPDDPAELTRYLIDRERGHWAQLYERGRRDGLDFLTSPGVLGGVVFTAALTGPRDWDAGVAAVRAPDPEQVLRDHTKCYPPAVPDRATVLEPLYPDRLAEDYLALCLTGEGTAEHPALLERVLSAEDTVRAMTFLIAAAVRWPVLGPRHLFPRVLARPHQVLDAGSAAVATLTAVPEVGTDVLEAVEALLPPGPHVDLDVGAAALSTTLTARRRETVADPVDLARVLVVHAARLANAGRFAESAAVADEAGRTLYRAVEAGDLDQVPHLASALSGLSFYRSRGGRHEEALAPAEAAVRLGRQLAGVAPEVFQPFLAGSLSMLGTVLSDLGRPQEAVAPTGEAVVIFHGLTGDRHRPDLARALTNLGKVLAEVGRPVDGRGPAQDGVRLSRDLAAADPAAHLPDLALALTNLARLLHLLGDHPAALAAAEEGRDRYRDLAEGNPRTYLPPYTRALHNVSAVLADLGRDEEGLAQAVEAVALRRELARADPVAHRPGLASSLISVSALLAALGRLEEARAPSGEAMDLMSELADTNTAAYGPLYALALNNMGSVLARLGDQAAALDLATRALELRQWLTEHDTAAYHRAVLELEASGPAVAIEAGPGVPRPPAEAVTAHRANLGMSLYNVGYLLSETGRPEEALVKVGDALDAFRQAAVHNPGGQAAPLARSLNLVSMLLFDQGRRPEAIDRARECVAVTRELALANPGSYRSQLAVALNNLSGWLWNEGQRDEALAAAEEARDIYAVTPEPDPGDYAMLCGTLGRILAGHGRAPEGLRYSGEAVDRFRVLAADDPREYRGQFAMSVNNLASQVHDTDVRRARALADEAVTVYRQLADEEPGQLHHLAMALTNAGRARSGLGEHRTALLIAQEAATIMRGLVAENPAAHLPQYGVTLHNLAGALNKLARWPEAFAAVSEAIRVRHGLTAQNPEAHAPSLANSLFLYALTGAESRTRLPESRAAAQESLRVFRLLATAYPAVFGPQVAEASQVVTYLGGRP